jgi:mannosyl-oligosaccharide alpha-1,2-mannosidase
MMGIAAKIFGREGDLEVAKKLVDGCMWAYDSMPSGIMPEVFSMVACGDTKSCPWDEKVCFPLSSYLTTD